MTISSMTLKDIQADIKHYMSLGEDIKPHEAERLLELKKARALILKARASH